MKLLLAGFVVVLAVSYAVMAGISRVDFDAPGAESEP